MKRVFLAAMVVILVVTATFGSGIAAAQDNSELSEAQVLIPVLAVKAPRLAQVGEPVTITVVDRGSGVPVGGASIYALGKPAGMDNVPAATDTPLTLQDYSCEFLGESDGNGEVIYTFEGKGRFLIIATKDGYGPGFARLLVGPVIKRLKIESPRKAHVGQPVTFKVVDRESGSPIEGASMYALDGLDLKMEADSDVRPQIEDVVAAHGESLGSTDENGELVYSFEEAGKYIIVAIKEGYRPGIKPIGVFEGALAIKAPRRAQVDEPVTFKVMVRDTDSPVEGADLYALAIPFPRFAPMPPPNVETEATFTLLEAEVKGSPGDIIAESRKPLGKTDGNGELVHSFQEEGMYLIVATKDGYIRAVTRLAIGHFEFPREVLPQLKQFNQHFLEKGNPNGMAIRHYKESPMVEGWGKWQCLLKKGAIAGW